MGSKSKVCEKCDDTGSYTATGFWNGEFERRVYTCACPNNVNAAIVRAHFKILKDQLKNAIALANELKKLLEQR